MEHTHRVHVSDCTEHLNHEKASFRFSDISPLSDHFSQSLSRSISNMYNKGGVDEKRRRKNRNMKTLYEIEDVVQKQ